MRRVLWLLLLTACGEGRDIPQPSGPVDGGPRADAGLSSSRVIDATDAAALNECWAPTHVFGDPDAPLNCATECPGGMQACGPICVPDGACQGVDWRTLGVVHDADHSAACDTDKALTFRGEVAAPLPMWPQKRCD